MNAYGETKALMEKLFQQADTWSETAFNCVRYGNVLGSRGSVVPLFRQQLREGRCTITDPCMTRFWMTLDEAVELVTYACDPHVDEVADGAILVPPCKAANMITLLTAVNKLWGDGSDEPPDYTTIGARAGEKQHEQLVHVNESLRTLRPRDTERYFQIMPATSDVHGDPFEYRSDTADQLSVAELCEMLAGCDD